VRAQMEREELDIMRGILRAASEFKTGKKDQAD
jgi:tRNA C32,U32 (ribose-2'-O)-methylase TrmJ